MILFSSRELRHYASKNKQVLKIKDPALFAEPADARVFL